MSTKIEWTDETWNPVTGCSPISEGCVNCYAKRMSKRLAGRCGYSKDDPFRVTLHPERLDKPFRWKKPRRIFVCSMGDLFHNAVPFEFISAVFGAMAANSRHTFQILTKRPERMLEFFRRLDNFEDDGDDTPPQSLECSYQLLMHEAEYYPASYAKSNGFGWPIHCKWGPAPDAPWPLPNVHIGVTAENQKRADERISLLLQIPAAKRFVSIEPMLGPINLGDYLIDKTRFKLTMGNYLDQVIVGAETGPGKRQMNIDLARDIRDLCQETSTPFFFKKDSLGNHELDGVVWEEMPK